MASTARRRPDAAVDAPRRMPAAQRREAIVAAAAAVFAERGFDGASVADIARAAQVSEPLLYKHVGNKRELFLAALADNADGILADFASADTAPGGLRERMQALYAARFDTASNPRPLLLRSVTTSDDPEIAAALREANRRVVDGAAAILAQGIADASLRPDLDVEAVAWIVGAIFRSRDARLFLLGAEACADLDRRIIDQLVDLVAATSGDDTPTTPSRSPRRRSAD